MAATESKLILVVAGIFVVIALGYILITQGASFLRSLLPGTTTTTDKPNPGSTKTTTDGTTVTTTTVPDDNTITRTTTGLGGLNSTTVVGPDVKYVNPVICVLTGQFCDPNEDPHTVGDATKLPVSNPPAYAGYQNFPQTYTPGQEQGYTDQKEHLRIYYPDMYAAIYGGG
jgi:hypothetical protein